MPTKNIRGYVVKGGRKPSGPQNAATSRKTPWKKNIEKAEVATAAAVRNSEYGMTNDEIGARFIREAEKHNIMDYYPVVHGLGSAAMRLRKVVEFRPNALTRLQSDRVVLLYFSWCRCVGAVA